MFCILLSGFFCLQVVHIEQGLLSHILVHAAPPSPVDIPHHRGQRVDLSLNQSGMRGLILREEMPVVCALNGLGAAFDAPLAEDVVEMLFHGAHCDDQLCSNLAIGQALGGQTKDL